MFGSTFLGFLTHHVNDLEALSGALTAVLDAVPVNAETRQHIADMIDKVETSAVNVAASLENLSLTPDPVTIKESDIEAALSSVVKSGALDGIIAQAVAEYAAAHPVAAPVPTPPVETPAPPVETTTTDTGTTGA